MTHLLRRLRKLEATIKDDTALVPHSPEWLAYWTDKLDRIYLGEDARDGGPRVPLDAWDAVMASLGESSKCRG